MFAKKFGIKPDGIMNYLALKGEVSDFSLKNLSLDRKLSILRGSYPTIYVVVKNSP
jgi:hypothetical protein